jgi:hypothetical protein
MAVDLGLINQRPGRQESFLAHSILSVALVVCSPLPFGPTDNGRGTEWPFYSNSKR